MPLEFNELRSALDEWTAASDPRERDRAHDHILRALTPTILINLLRAYDEAVENCQGDSD
jgi:hypothetical protein